MDRKARMKELKEESHRLLLQRDKVHEELSKLEAEQARKDHPCECVMLNGDIKIYDMIEQERRNRRGLGFGFVSECLSALKDCPKCLGTGKPKGNYDEWCDDVQNIIVISDRELWNEVIRLGVEDTGELSPGIPSKFFKWLRGDETSEAFKGGDSPNDYASFLLKEYHLFGPRGE